MMEWGGGAGSRNVDITGPAMEWESQQEWVHQAEPLVFGGHPVDDTLLEF